MYHSMLTYIFGEGKDVGQNVQYSSNARDGLRLDQQRTVSPLYFDLNVYRVFGGWILTKWTQNLSLENTGSSMEAYGTPCQILAT